MQGASVKCLIASGLFLNLACSQLAFVVALQLLARHPVGSRCVQLLPMLLLCPAQSLITSPQPSAPKHRHTSSTHHRSAVLDDAVAATTAILLALTAAALHEVLDPINTCLPPLQVYMVR